MVTPRFDPNGCSICLGGIREEWTRRRDVGCAAENAYCRPPLGRFLSKNCSYYEWLLYIPNSNVHFLFFLFSLSLKGNWSWNYLHGAFRYQTKTVFATEFTVRDCIIIIVITRSRWNKCSHAWWQWQCTTFSVITNACRKTTQWQPLRRATIPRFIWEGGEWSSSCGDQPGPERECILFSAHNSGPEPCDTCSAMMTDDDVQWKCH